MGSKQHFAEAKKSENFFVKPKKEVVSWHMIKKW